MIAVADGNHITGRGRRLSTAAATFVTFLLAGPLIGGSTIFVALIALAAVPPDFAHDFGGAFFYSCLTVALPVVLVGVLITVRQAMGRPVAVTLAVGLGAIVGVVWGLFLASEGATGTLSTLAFVGTTVATPACWRLTHMLAGPR